MLDNVGLIDFHTHILPQMDDGSQSSFESMRMLQTLSDDGVVCVALTPHFYAGVDTPDSFFKRRNASYTLLQNAIRSSSDANIPKLMLGAEVEYFEGISVSDELRDFQIGNSQCLLLEMPPGPWTSRMVSDVLDLNNRHDCRVILAHFERYFFDQPEDTLQALKQGGVIMQSNGASFLYRWTAAKTFKMLKHGFVHVLGSDCHNMSTRPPDMGKACAVIARRAGEDTLKQMMHTAHNLLFSEDTAVHE